MSEENLLFLILRLLLEFCPKLKLLKMRIIKINYLPIRSRINTNERCAIKCRITYNKKRKEFSTGLLINQTNWNSKQKLVKTTEPDNDYINNQLSLIKTKINKAFLMLVQLYSK